MLESFGVIFLTGMAMGWLSKKCRLPALTGMILTGILLGPYVFSVISGEVLDIAAQLRQTALVIILMRAGLSLDVKELIRAGRPAILMCFVPALFEIGATMVFAPLLFGVSYIEAAVIGAITAAVSPAVIVPRMINLINEKYGTDKQIPQIILAGASADDVLVIVLFTSFSAIAGGQNASILDYIQVPTSIILGAAVGAGTGILLRLFFARVHIRDTAKVVITISVAFLLLFLEKVLSDSVHLSGLIAIMAMGMAIYAGNKELAKRLGAKYNKLWAAAEIVLFVLVGAAVNPSNIASFGISTLILLLCTLSFRMAGVFVSLLGTNLSMKERLFCMIAYTPKATVQAAIGAVPLSMGLPCGELALSVAVLAILITAPFGAFAIDLSYKKLLSKNE